MKTFEQWDIDDVERTFSLLATRENQHLSAWLKAEHIPLPEEAFLLQHLQEDLLQNVDLWNEDELKFKFIAPLVSLARYNSEKFRVFTQRILTATVRDRQENEIVLSGRVDFVVATGKAKPIQPFFFLHEYKKERAAESDPRAQLLVEMIASRALNAISYPLYGCYVVGRNWFFLVLDGNTYTESIEYSASHEDDLRKIFSVLREAKIIITRLAEQYA
jgi:hypothetical protein